MLKTESDNNDYNVHFIILITCDIMDHWNDMLCKQLSWASAQIITPTVIMSFLIAVHKIHSIPPIIRQNRWSARHYKHQLVASAQFSLKVPKTNGQKTKHAVQTKCDSIISPFILSRRPLLCFGFWKNVHCETYSNVSLWWKKKVKRSWMVHGQFCQQKNTFCMCI